MLPPGRDIDGKRISRSVLWLNLSASVSSQAKNPEACYLFLQWVGSSRIYAWMTAKSGGYFDPFRLSDFSDPLVRQTYHAYHMDIVRETVPRTVPSINYPGATAFHNALDENLVAACAKTKTPEQAMADTEREWKRIARRVGEEQAARSHQDQQGGVADRDRSDRAEAVILAAAERGGRRSSPSPELLASLSMQRSIPSNSSATRRSSRRWRSR